jgi:hypothetical protein
MTKHEFGVVLYAVGNGNLIDMSFSLSGMPDEAHPADYEEAVIDLLRDTTPAAGHSIYQTPVKLALGAWNAPGTEVLEPKVSVSSGLLSDEAFKTASAVFPADILKHVKLGDPDVEGAYQHLVWQYKENISVHVMLFSKFTD